MTRRLTKAELAAGEALDQRLAEREAGKAARKRGPRRTPPTPGQIRAQRRRAFLSRAEYARCIHASVRTVQNYELGIRRMPAAVFNYAAARIAGTIERFDPTTD